MPSVDNVADISPTAQYTASGGQTVFAYPFPIFEDDNLIVFDEDTQQALTTDYTVSGAGDDTGGNVTFLTGRTAGNIITIYRDVPMERLTDFQQNGPRRSADMNDELDRITMYVQQLKRDVGRKIGLSLRNPQASSELTLDPISTWLERYLFINASGELEPAVNVTGTTLTQSVIGAALYPQTAEELSAGVTIVNYAYPQLCVNRYGTNTVPGTTSMHAAWQAAIDVAKVCGGEITWDSTMGPHLIDDELDCTQAAGTNNKGYVFRGTGDVQAITLPPSVYAPDVIFNHTGHCFDCTGANGIMWENMAVTTTGSVPLTCWFWARNSSGGGSLHRITNCRTIGSWSEAVLYNYGAEEDTVRDCQFFNRAGTANAKLVVFTSTNFRGLTSNFTTIATGSQSTISHLVDGGSYMNFSHHASADVFYLDTVPFVRLKDFWVECADATGAGRSIVYVDTTNGPSEFLQIDGVQDEQGIAPETFGIYVGDTAALCSFWSIRNSIFSGATKVFRSHANVDFAALKMESIGDSSVGAGGVDILGDVDGDSRINSIPGSLTIGGTLGDNNKDLLNKIISRSGEANLTLEDLSAASGARRGLLRYVNGQFLFSLAGNTGTVYANAINCKGNGSVCTAIDIATNQINITTLPQNFANDGAAAAGGIAIGGVYRNGSVLMVRVA